MASRPAAKVAPSTALAAAFLVAFHTFLTALSLGAHAAPSSLDAFGNPLCLGSVSFGKGGEAPDRSHTGMDCCAFGCHVAAAVPLLSRIPVLLHFDAPAVSIRLFPDFVPRRLDLALSAIRPRGPPRPV
jgi:hypothetical protein